MADSIGCGATFAGTAASGLTTVAGITGINIPEFSVDDIETTDMDTTNNAKTFIAGLIDYGECSLELKYDKSNYDALLSAVGLADTFTITLPDTSTFAFPGYLKSAGGDVPVDNLITNAATFKVSGEPTFTAAV